MERRNANQIQQDKVHTKRHEVDYVYTKGLFFVL